MNIEKNMNTRIQHKHDTEANWNKAVNFIPKTGELIVYDIDENYNYSRFKIGDGVRTINNLEFSQTDLTGYATESYVNEGLATKQPVGDYALKSDIPTDYLKAVPAEYVTEYELNSKGYLTEQSLDGLATETFVTEQIAGKADIGHVHSWDQLTDKPFYEEVTRTVIADEHTRTGTQYLLSSIEGYVINNTWLDGSKIIAGDTYIVTVDGVDYEGIATDEGSDYPYIFDDTFANAPVYLQVINARPIRVMPKFIDSLERVEHTIKLTHVERTLKPIDSKFIGDDIARVSDIPEIPEVPTVLDENGKLLDSVMPEGTGYFEGTRIEEVFPVTTVDTEGSTYGAIPEYEFIEGQTYFVTFNGTEYECIAWYDKENFGCAMVGKGTLYSDWVDPSWGEDVPFCLETSYLNVSEAGVYTIGVKTSVDDYHVIPEKYLPPVVGRLGTGKNSEIFNNYDYNIASGESSHAEGSGTEASGQSSHAEGNGGLSGMTLYLTGDANATTYTVTEWSSDVIKIGRYVYDSNNGLCKIVSFSEAESTITFDKSINPKIAFNQRLISFRSGIAAGKYSHIEGNNTIAYSESQHVQGRYNLEDFDGKYAHIVGNGQKEALSNAHTLDWDGNAWFAGGLKISGTSQDDVAAKIVATLDDIPSIEGLATEDFVTQQIANLVNSAPDALNTLYELAAALGDDENFATTVTNQIAAKQDAITGTAGQFVVIGTNGKPTTKTILIAEEASF